MDSHHSVGATLVLAMHKCSDVITAKRFYSPE